ncbi:hypothetical protein T02_3661 [Trichinella nativa]|uniref:Uncharacterized protein n=1 Tax=Trichinella nativa TaxID=6335 RepID=A0A0V1KND2_9BILA|nr:hypothetical protein T02_3661 [Trichinella nativa]
MRWYHVRESTAHPDERDRSPRDGNTVRQEHQPSDVAGRLTHRRRPPGHLQDYTSREGSGRTILKEGGSVTTE